MNFFRFMKMKSSGVIKYLLQQYLGNQIDNNNINQKWYQVTMDHITGVLVWYFSMILLSLVILGIEILLYKKSHPEQHENLYHWID